MSHGCVYKQDVTCCAIEVNVSFSNLFISFFFKILFIHERQREREKREKQAPCREPDVGLDFGTPGSHPGLKAGVKLLSHPGIPRMYFFKEFLYLFMRDTQREAETYAEGKAEGA